MGHAVVADRGQPPEPLAPEVLDLGIAEHAHGAGLMWAVILTVIPPLKGMMLSADHAERRARRP
jgi:hypothetical protein